MASMAAGSCMSSFNFKSIHPPKRTVSNFTIRSIATPIRPPSVVVPLPEIDTPARPNHVAWTSVQQERWEGELSVQGQLPCWLNGTYLRNGPGIWHIADYDFRHLFDGYATIVKLQFDNGRLFAGHRQIESDAYKAAMKNQKICYREFSEVPKTKNFLAYVGELANLLSGASLTDNAKHWGCEAWRWSKTQKGSIMINPTTLETVGKFEYSDSLGGLIHSAHPIVTDSEFLTLLPDLLNPGYLVVRMEPSSNERKVIGRVNCKGGPAPGWVHSFPVTENYVVVPEMPLRYCAQNLLRAEPTPLYKFEWRPESKAYVHVMCKASGKIVASVEVPLYITFHFINAYDERDEKGRITAVIADCCEHNANPLILDRLRLHNLRRFTPNDALPDARNGIVQAGKVQNTTGWEWIWGAGGSIGPRRTWQRIDLVKKTAKNWHEAGAIPSEPFFVARPGATEEDDGVVISMVSGEDGEGYALLLDGSTFEEIARAKFPYGLPYGLHGCWIPRN
ncbi:Carotenoid cleavage dioxygenase 8-like B, chloroplastic, partial [Cucurbita argyrosperma subsp. argyrosperma]